MNLGQQQRIGVVRALVNQDIIPMDEPWCFRSYHQIHYKIERLQERLEKNLSCYHDMDEALKLATNCYYERR